MPSALEIITALSIPCDFSKSGCYGLARRVRGLCQTPGSGIFVWLLCLVALVLNFDIEGDLYHVLYGGEDYECCAFMLARTI